MWHSISQSSDEFSSSHSCKDSPLRQFRKAAPQRPWGAHASSSLLPGQHSLPGGEEQPERVTRYLAYLHVEESLATLDEASASWDLLEQHSRWCSRPRSTNDVFGPSWQARAAGIIFGVHGCDIPNSPEVRLLMLTEAARGTIGPGNAGPEHQGQPP